MNMSFPDESASYRAARELLLAQEIELRRAMETVAEARRHLPPGGLVPEDYVFEGEGSDSGSAKVRLSDLFAPNKDSGDRQGAAAAYPRVCTGARLAAPAPTVYRRQQFQTGLSRRDYRGFPVADVECVPA